MLPGGILALVVSGPAYNTARPRRIVVELVTEALPAAGALLAPLPQRLAQLGVAVIGEPMTVPLAWFPASATSRSPTSPPTRSTRSPMRCAP